MTTFIQKKFIVTISIFVILAIVAKESIADIAIPKYGQNPLRRDSIFGHYIWGTEVPAAYVMDTNSYKTSYSWIPEEIVLGYNYTNAKGDKITQIIVYLDSADNTYSKASISYGGIGESSVSLRMSSKNTKYLRFMVIVFGVKNG